MNWAAGFGSGFGLGLLYFGDIERSVRALSTGQRSILRLGLGRVPRLSLAALVFYALLMTGGAVLLLAGLIGLWSARWSLIRELGRSSDGR
jgi:hypothetical protein